MQKSARISLGLALSSILTAGVARAHVDMALEGEALHHRFGLPSQERTKQLALEIDTDRSAKMDRALGLPYGMELKDESNTIRGNQQADVYASAADLVYPLPDRLSVNTDSRFYKDCGNIGVRFDGSDRPGDVEEYCISEGWIRVRTFMSNGKPKRERGKYICLKRFGKVEPYRK